MFIANIKLINIIRHNHQQMSALFWSKETGDALLREMVTKSTRHPVAVNLIFRLRLVVEQGFYY